MRMRLDALLVSRALAESREKARALIPAGKVEVAGHPTAKAGTAVPVDADVRVAEPDLALPAILVGCAANDADKR